MWGPCIHICKIPQIILGHIKVWGSLSCTGMLLQYYLKEEQKEGILNTRGLIKIMIIQWYSAALNMWYRSRFIDMEKCSHRIAKSRLHYSMYYLVTFLFLNMCVGDDRISTVLISGWYPYFSLFSSRVSDFL